MGIDIDPGPLRLLEDVVEVDEVMPCDENSRPAPGPFVDGGGGGNAKGLGVPFIVAKRASSIKALTAGSDLPSRRA
jgi:hypothetical protein